MKFIKFVLRLIILTVLLWASGFAFYFYAIRGMQPENPQKQTDAIVVLTGSENRVETGIELWAQGKAKYLFISGVNPQVTEAEIKALWKGTQVLPACCIALGRHSNSTIENAQETQEWVKRMNFRSIRLVTANYHMPRALIELSHTMPKTLIIPNPIEPTDVKINTKFYWELLISEYNKILLRWASLNLHSENRP